MTLDRLAKRALAPVDLASLAVMRIAWGAILFIGLVRFVSNGWVDVQYVQPTFFFKYDGFSWVNVPGPVGLYALFAFTAACALFVALGLGYRFAAAGYAIGFTWIQLLDVTNYLNHYYLVVLVACWLPFLPLNRVYSVDAWIARRRGRPMPEVGARLWLWLLRAQIACVYIGAALAKVHPDWLLHAQPLGIWMNARTELPLIGPLLGEAWVVYFMSWAGFLYDLTIVGWLSWRRTRPFALVVVLCFHSLTHVFFDIGLFPFLMTCAVLVFFSPSWPRRLLGYRAPRTRGFRGPSKVWLVVVALYLSLQVVVPLRHLAIPGDVVWTEEGMRLSWKVMVREKNGSVTYHVKDRATGRLWQVSPHDYLTWRQANEMSAQPDLIVQLAKHIGGDFARRGHDVEVRAEVWVSLNGRPRALLLDPSVDLVRVDERQVPAPWINPIPETPPLEVR
jgi:hypothetical protein